MSAEALAIVMFAIGAFMEMFLVGSEYARGAFLGSAATALVWAASETDYVSAAFLVLKVCFVIPFLLAGMFL